MTKKTKKESKKEQRDGKCIACGDPVRHIDNDYCSSCREELVVASTYRGG